MICVAEALANNEDVHKIVTPDVVDSKRSELLEFVRSAFAKKHQRTIEK